MVLFCLALKLTAVENHAGKNRKAETRNSMQAVFQMTFLRVGAESLQLLLAALRPGHQFSKQYHMGRSLLNAREFWRKKASLKQSFWRTVGHASSIWEMLPRKAGSPLLTQRAASMTKLL